MPWLTGVNFQRHTYKSVVKINLCFMYPLWDRGVISNTRFMCLFSSKLGSLYGLSSIGELRIKS
jgi:hypothetical protein